MNEDERMSDTLSKWERISKGSSIREMKLVFKVEYHELSKRMCTVKLQWLDHLWDHEN